MFTVSILMYAPGCVSLLPRYKLPNVRVETRVFAFPLCSVANIAILLRLFFAFWIRLAREEFLAIHSPGPESAVATRYALVVSVLAHTAQEVGSPGIACVPSVNAVPVRVIRIVVSWV